MPLSEGEQTFFASVSGARAAPEAPASEVFSITAPSVLVASISFRVLAMSSENFGCRTHDMRAYSVHNRLDVNASTLCRFAHSYMIGSGGREDHRLGNKARPGWPARTVCVMTAYGGRSIRLTLFDAVEKSGFLLIVTVFRL